MSYFTNASTVTNLTSVKSSLTMHEHLTSGTRFMYLHLGPYIECESNGDSDEAVHMCMFVLDFIC